MKFIKYFKLYLESISTNISINNWKISYFHNKSHDLDNKISSRTNVSNDAEFVVILNKIVQKCEGDNLNGNYTFVDIKYSIKLVTDVDNNNKELLIITILGKNEYSRKNDILIVI